MSVAQNNKIFAVEGTTVTATMPFIIWCGCGGMDAHMTNPFKRAEINHRVIPRVKKSGNRTAVKWLRDNGYFERFPSLNKSKYAVFVNPVTGKGVELYPGQKATNETDIQFRERVTEAVKEVHGTHTL